VVDADEILALELDRRERELLRWGVIEWGGPAKCTEEMARAMGFASVDDLFAQTDRLTSAIAAGAMSRLDWMRVLLATEVVFASDVLGSGIDWEATSGLSDEDSIAILRRVQRKLAGLRQLVGNGFGTPRGG
jgi:hypothetical protein